MSDLRWALRLDEVEPRTASAWVWLVALGDQAVHEALAQVRARRCDLTDAAALVDPDRGAARLIRRRLLRALAGRWLGCHVDDVIAARTPDGRPSIAAPRRLYASCTQRGGWTGLALATRPVGVDIEDAAPAHPLPLDILQKDARTWIDVGPHAAARFSQVWTAYEALAKAAGGGLQAALGASSCVPLEFDRSELHVRGADLSAICVSGMVASAVLLTGGWLETSANRSSVNVDS